MKYPMTQKRIKTLQAEIKSLKGYQLCFVLLQNTIHQGIVEDKTEQIEEVNLEVKELLNLLN